MSSQKPLLLFGIARSGTSPFANVIGHYLKHTRGIIRLGEYFNHDGHIFRFQENQIRAVNPPFFVQRPTPQQRALILEQKFEYLKTAPEQYFMKLHPTFGSPEILEWLNQTYDWIFVERQNVFQHFLSYAASKITDSWYRVGGLQIPNGSLVLDSKLIEEFREQVHEFERWKQKHSPKWTLVYEEFLENPTPSYILNKLGLCDVPVDLSVHIPQKQNPDDKLVLFAQPDVVLEAFENSALGKIYPTRQHAHAPSKEKNASCELRLFHSAET